LFLSRGQNRAALLTLSLGAVSGKIFLVLAVMGLIVCLPSLSIATRVTFGLMPMILGYGLQAAGGASADHGGLISFVPDAPFSISMLMWFAPMLSLSTAEGLYYSASLGLAVCAAIILYASILSKRRTARWSPNHIAALFYSLFSAFFIIFYHVNPEYIALLSACLLVMRPSMLLASSHFVLSGAAWSINLFYGIHRASLNAAASGGKATFVSAFNELSPFSAYTLFLLSLGLTWVLFCLVALLSVRAMPTAPSKKPHLYTDFGPLQTPS
jgi:hypothetical protein